jgi:AcrR family transcriptional regulator
MSYSIPIDSPPPGDAEPLDPSPAVRRAPNPPYRFVPHNEHERIQVAVAETVAAKGYKETTVGDICAAGDFSAQAFHEHFPGKREAVIDTLEAGADQRMTCCREAFETTQDWPESVWAAIQAYTDWMADNPTFARLGLVEVLAIGPAGVALLHSIKDAFAIFLAPGYRIAPADTPEARVVDETVANSAFRLLHRHVVRESPETLPTIVPELALAVLTPFLGAEQAASFVAERATRG